MLERSEQDLSHIVFPCRVAQSFQSLHAHRWILVLARRVEQSEANLLVTHRRLQNIQAVQAHPGIEPLAVFDHIR